MIRDSEKKPWEYVVVWKLDRFARNRTDSALFKFRLRKNGVKVISATENISEKPEGIILEAVLEGMAEFYSADPVSYTHLDVYKRQSPGSTGKLFTSRAFPTLVLVSMS